MRPLVGLGLDGPTFTPRDLPSDAARVGEPTWGLASWLRDLELRLGLPSIASPSSVRVPCWRARIASLNDTNAFYALSFVTDPIGTAETLLKWRDALIDAGWNGENVAGGGDRIDALTAIEKHVSPALPPGNADRLLQVERELEKHPTKIYDELLLVEERDLFPTRWQRIFDALEKQGTTFRSLELQLSRAPADTDLGALQSLLRDESPPSNLEIRGDGSLLLIRGDTPAELAELIAAYLAHDDRARDAAVVRAIDPGPLETALARYGFASQGHRSPSLWRPAMQVLPLAIELAFDPRDPYRVLELLTLPLGPFRGLIGSALAKAVASQPGIGGERWVAQKKRALELLREKRIKLATEGGASEKDAINQADEYVAERTKRIYEWLEAPGAPALGAPRAHVLAAAQRVRDWLQRRMGTREKELYGPAHGQAKDFVEALLHDPATTWSLDEVRTQLDQLARKTHAHQLTIEEAGRLSFVSHPDALLSPRDTVVTWGFVAAAEKRTPRSPWNEAERSALAASGVMLPDPTKHLEAEAAAWRRCVLAARKRAILVVPRCVKGQPMAPHPLWDEIHARLGLTAATATRITLHARAVVVGGSSALATIKLSPALRLPDGHALWTIDPALLINDQEERGASATSLEKLSTCPLAWVLAQRAKLRRGAIAKVARGPLLNGNLSHRLVEELHHEGAFALDEPAFLAKADATRDRLIATEGATLLLPGNANERQQLGRQIHNAMRSLFRYLRTSGFTIVAVEENIEAESAIGMLHGRLDLRVVDAQGRPAVIDLKWGASRYRAALQEGRAVQLAAYASAIANEGDERPWGNELPPAGYFALSGGKLLAVDPRMKGRSLKGPTLAETWTKVEATAQAVLASLERGAIPVAGTKRSLPLLDALQIPPAEHPRHFSVTKDLPCEYCDYGALCGRAWEVPA